MGTCLDRNNGRGGGGGGEEVADEKALEASSNDLERIGIWIVGREGAVFGRAFCFEAVVLCNWRGGRGGSPTEC